METTVVQIAETAALVSALQGVSNQSESSTTTCTGSRVDSIN